MKERRRIVQRVADKGAKLQKNMPCLQACRDASLHHPIAAGQWACTLDAALFDERLGFVPLASRDAPLVAPPRPRVDLHRNIHRKGWLLTSLGNQIEVRLSVR